MGDIIYCNNCGKLGHQYHQCKLPITSYGIICFRRSPFVSIDISNSIIQHSKKSIEYLLIRRKDTLGYVDFIRGKYPINNIQYIMNMLNEMTNDERRRICEVDFKILWNDLWGEKSKVGVYQRIEEKNSNDKLKQLRNGIYIDTVKTTIVDLIENTKRNWEEPEWGFPKGRRNHLECDLDCSIREWEEETGYTRNNLDFIQNILPLEEIFTGSNYKSYKHKYYVAEFISNKQDSKTDLCDTFERNEVGKMEWKSFFDALYSIRPYNYEKMILLKNLHDILSKHII